jgi:hypothetical protein
VWKKMANSILMLPGSEHNLHIETPEETAKAIIKILN